MTMADFVSKALDDELHPKIQEKEIKYMGAMRTMAFQVPEDLFQQIKEYLERHNMTQKQFVLGLIQDELDRDYEERMSENQEVSQDEPDEDEDESEEYDEDEAEDEELDDDEELSEEDEESEDEDMSMEM